MDYRRLTAADKLFRLAIGIRLVISETKDPDSAEQLKHYLKQLGL